MTFTGVLKPALLLFALRLALDLLGYPSASAHNAARALAQRVDRPDILKGHQLASSSRGGDDGTIVQQLETQHAGKLERSMRHSGFKGTQSQLLRQLQLDEDMAIHLESEAVMYECRGMLPDASRSLGEVSAAAAAWQLGAGVVPTAADPLADQAFSLSSRTASKNKMWLDFQGGIIEGTAWNAFEPTIEVPPYSSDADLTTFSIQERSDIAAIWRAVSEDYSPFDIDVTTFKPDASVPPSHYVRVCIGGDGAWYGSPGGLSYVGVFGRNDTYYQPVFIFPQMLGPYHAKYVWEAVSHEVGHVMGLLHDGTSSTPYYEGQGAWAPIMGIGYYRPLTQFSKGEYTDANQLQDDVAIVAGKLGYAPKENGDSIATATLLAANVSGTTATAVAYGVVSQAGIAEFFKFQAAAGSATIQAQLTPGWTDTTGNVNNRADLAVQLTVYGATGGIIASIKPSSSETLTVLDVLAMSLALPGTYYVSVAGAGAGNVEMTGYTAYGSLGRFALLLTYPTPAATSPLAPPSPKPPPPQPPKPTMDVELSVTTAFNAKLAAMTCTASVHVSLTNGTTVAGAAVVGIWGSLPVADSFASITRGSTRVSGCEVGTFTAVSKALPSSTSTCQFSVLAVRKPGLALTTSRLPRVSAARKSSTNTP